MTTPTWARSVFEYQNLRHWHIEVVIVTVSEEDGSVVLSKKRFDIDNDVPAKVLWGTKHQGKASLPSICGKILLHEEEAYVREKGITQRQMILGGLECQRLRQRASTWQKRGSAG